MSEPVKISTDLAAVRDHRRDYGDFLYVYPVISRRSRGLSIGVNLNPDKVCNFNCVYCEVDRMTPARTRRLDLGVLRAELEEMLAWVRDGRLAADPRFREAGWMAREVRDIAFSGDGEPTMVPNFTECVQLVAEVKQKAGLAEARIVLITDAVGLDKLTVRRGLEIMDANQGEVWAKLDAGTEAYYRLVNRSYVRFERILSNVRRTAQVRTVIIQSLFLKVRGEVMPEAELMAYCDRLNELAVGGARIKAVHAYTVARPTPEAWATRLSEEELGAMAGVIRARTGLTVETFA
jgi:wyosine [tRNA(Phe)-imidazoG37] synthetase (radical SAM superfamily)